MGSAVPTVTDQPSNRLAFLDAMRGVAALWVVLFHFSQGGHMPALAAALPTLVNAALFDLGHLGVPIFFVMSGIVMTTTTARVPMTTGNGWRFVLRRMVRLSPPYYAAIAAALVILWFKVQLGIATMPSPSAVLAHMVYAQGLLGIENIAYVFWTLGIEVQFYIAFALMMWATDRSAISRVVVSWASALLALPWAFGWLSTPVWSGGFVNLWFSFMAGVLCGQALSRDGAWPVAVGYSALLAAVGLAAGDSFVLTTGLAGITVCLAAYWSPLRLALSHRVLQHLGLVSYSLYLFHSLVTGPTMRAVRMVVAPGPMADAAALAIVLCACLAVAFLAYHFIERPAIAWGRRIQFGTPVQPSSDFGRSTVGSRLAWRIMERWGRLLAKL